VNAVRAIARARLAHGVRGSLLALIGLLLSAPVRAEQDAPPVADPSLEARVVLHPGATELGRVVTYRAGLSATARGYVRLLPVHTEGAFSWGTPRVYLRGPGKRTLERDPYTRHRFPDLDTMGIEVPLQVFALGQTEVPGLALEIDQGQGQRIVQLPPVTVFIAPVLTAADSAADFRGLHGPLSAPWWERVPWLWVGLAALLGLAITAWRFARRRRRPVAAPVAPAPIVMRGDPLAEALAALAELRALGLPEQGRFAEHAFRLGQILRRYLEVIVGVVQPGDTTPELVHHLEDAGVEPEEVAPLSRLLRSWDQVKFAREPYTLDEAQRAERAVETHLRRAGPASQRVA
jgi:hypothetical protein